jgi:hypothetical protein
VTLDPVNDLQTIGETGEYRPWKHCRTDLVELRFRGSRFTKDSQTLAEAVTAEIIQTGLLAGGGNEHIRPDWQRGSVHVAPMSTTVRPMGLRAS